MNETRAEFEKRYSGGFPQTKFGVNKISMRCTCDSSGFLESTHWAAIRNTPESIHEHLEHEQVLAELRQEGKR